MASENPSWGYTRIRGGLYNLRHDLGGNTIKRMLEEHGLEPAPERGEKTPWASFLKAPWGAIAATDFLTVEVLTLRGLVRYAVLCVIDLKTPSVRMACGAREPNGALLAQMARDLTDVCFGAQRERFLLQKHYGRMSWPAREALCGARFVQIWLVFVS